MTAGETQLQRWAELADHLTQIMQLTISEFLDLVESHIKGHEEAGSVSSKHKDIKFHLILRETRHSLGVPVDALLTVHDAKCIFQRRTRCVHLRNRSGTPRCSCKHSYET